MGQPSPPPGWYPAPDGRPLWWDGVRWADPQAGPWAQPPAAQPRPAAQQASPYAPAAAPSRRPRTGAVVAIVAGVALLLCLALSAGAWALTTRGGDDGGSAGRPTDAQAVAAVRRALLPCSPHNGLRMTQAKVVTRSGDEVVVRAPGVFGGTAYTVDFTVAPSGDQWAVSYDGSGVPPTVDLTCVLEDVARE